MSKWLLKYNYPQIVFAKQISDYLLKTGKSFGTIIDCPCGNGETSWHIAKLTHSKVIAADISTESVARAKENFSGAGIKYEIKDIESVLTSEKQFNAFCIINSLFLLDNYDSILKHLSDSVSQNKAQLLVIIPNTSGRNFRWFQTKNKNENKLLIEEKEIKWFFEKYNFETKFVKPICYTHHYNRTDVKFLSVFWSVYLNILNLIQTALKIGTPNYFLIALTSKPK